MNIDNQDKSRAIKAEKQVERLERELELLKSRIKKTGTTSSTKELDKINFQLQEQVKDLKYQLKNQQSEYSKLKETLTTKTTEYEEKLKRMREIFGQASKNIDKYRVTIASKDVEIERLKTELQESQMKEHTYKATSESQQLTIEKVNAEITNAKTFYGTEIKQMEAKNRQLTIQLEQTKNDYEQYKKRARTLLETSKEEKLNLVRIDELEKLVQQLQAEKMKYKREQTEHQSLLEYDLRKTLDRICELETIQNKLIKENNVKEGIINELKASFKQEKENLEAASSKELNELKFKYEAQIQELAINNNVDDLTQELIQCKVRIHNLEEANDSLQQQLLGKENEKETLTTTTTTSSDSSNTQLSQYDDNDQDVYASMSSLLSTFISYQTPDEKISLEKQVQRLSEMLHESEEKIIALKSQEKVLKDELRKMDAFDKRQNMNVEYLKNVLISFLTSNNKQAMVPILSKLLCLDETETNAIMKNCI